MKLLEKNNRIFIRFMALLLLLGSILFYVSVNWIARSEIDEKLEVNQKRTINLIDEGQLPPQFAPIVEVKISPKKSATTEGFSDVQIFDPEEGEEEPFRQLVAEVEIKGAIYRITNRSPLLESEDLILAIGNCTAALVLLLFVWMYSRSSQKLWEPFHQQLQAIKGFSVSQNEPLTLASSEITEFEELKTALHELTEKGRSDFQNLKEFTENASHEMQTPLAIIQTKLEDTLQSSDLTEEQARHLAVANDAVLRLTRLNRSLLLLSKISNHQFIGEELVSISRLLKTQVNQLADFIKEKKLTLRMDLPEDVLVKAHPTLVETLLFNLLVNAVRHNVEGGTIDVTLTNQSLNISNTGHSLDLPSDQLFERFKKGAASQESLGLGLAIVKKICEVNKWEIEHSYQNGVHRFAVSFQ
ncbi:MAG: HAMP domain-containing sensor histidine kinase [Saprospiraceae bacterium]